MNEAVALKAKDYKNEVEPIWCAGCGDYGDLAAFTQALASMQLDPKDICIVSGIGCSGRFSHFIKGYAYHTAHGRALPSAIGVKAANPNLHVFVVGGDGDGFSIGGGHIPHAARRNPDITYLVIDNAIYGLTKGQVSPTSPFGMVSSTTPFGLEDPPLDPVPMLLSYGVSFVARGFSSEVKQVAKLVQEAVAHKGFCRSSRLALSHVQSGDHVRLHERTRRADSRRPRPVKSRRGVSSRAESGPVLHRRVLSQCESAHHGAETRTAAASDDGSPAAVARAAVRPVLGRAAITPSGPVD
jgi:hypothetical protein